MVSKEEFVDWKVNLVTKAFFEAAEERVSDAKDILASTAGNDPNNDSFMRGFIAAYREMQGFEVEGD
jgi:hypothetical protein